MGRTTDDSVLADLSSRTPYHPITLSPSVTDSSWRADAGTAGQSSHGRAAGQTFVAGGLGAGDALAADTAAGTRTAESVRAAVAGAAIDTVRAPGAGHRTGDGVCVAEPAEALAGWGAGAGAAGAIRIVGAADQPRGAGAEHAGLTAAVLLGAGQNRRRAYRAPEANSTRDGRGCRLTQPRQRRASRLPAGESAREVVESCVVHVLPFLCRASSRQRAACARGVAQGPAAVLRLKTCGSGASPSSQPRLI
jgi:hypothetical protein